MIRLPATVDPALTIGRAGNMLILRCYIFRQRRRGRPRSLAAGDGAGRDGIEPQRLEPLAGDFDHPASGSLSGGLPDPLGSP